VEKGKELHNMTFEELAHECLTLNKALQDCWHLANVYDANYAKACDNVRERVSSCLREIDERKKNK